MSEIVNKFTDLIVWQKGHEMVLAIYQITNSFPEKEKFNLISQLNRAIVSFTSNIAEGFSRYYFKDKIRFYYHSRGSLSEVVNLLFIARDLKYITNEQFANLQDKAKFLSILLNGLIQNAYSCVNRQS